MVKRLFIPLLIAIAGLLITVPVLAAYYVNIDVTESNGTSYDMLPVAVTMPIDYLADNQFIRADGRDVRIKDNLGSDVPFMLVEDRVVFASDITGDMTSRFQLTTGNSLLGDFHVCIGDGGYVTVADHANLELGDDFEIEFGGYVDTASIYEYPTVADTASSGADETTSHTIDLPSNIAAGDLLLLSFGGFEDNPIARTLTLPDGWTTLVNRTGDHIIVGVAYKIADGGEGSSVTATTSRTMSSAHQTFRITGYQGVPAASSSSSEMYNTNPDPTSLTTTWSNKTLWVAGFGGGAGADISLSSYPSDYSAGSSVENKNGALNEWSWVASCMREYKVYTEDPGVYTMSGNTRWFSWTVGIQGSGDYLVRKDCAYNLIAGGGKVEANIFGASVKTVTATLPSGVYTVNIWADGTNFGIDIDDSTEDSTALGGVSVPDNGNNLIILNVPYYNYYTHTTSDTLRIDYDPDSIISGTTLPNEENPGTHDGIITWGSNPAGISVSKSGLQSEETYYIEDIDSAHRDIIEPEPAELISGVNLERLESNPFHPLVEAILDASGGNLTASLIWIGGAWFLFIAAVVGTFLLSKQQLVFTSAVGLGLSILFYVMGIFDYWIIIIFAFGTVAAVIHERMPTW